MKVIILAAGQGTRLRPLTDEKPKCMVEVRGKSLLMYQLETMKLCKIKEEDIYVLAGYRQEVIKEALKNTKINVIINDDYEKTNMVFTLMCAKKIFESEEDIIVSYGDIIYTSEVLSKLLGSEEELSVVVDNGWYSYWEKRCENPLDDAETLIMDQDRNLVEIGQKTNDIKKVESQYIGLMRYRNKGVKKVLELCNEAKRRSGSGMPLWRTTRNYDKMYMTDLLQGLIDMGNKLKAVEIDRGWYEVDCYEDLKLAESELE